MSSRASKSSTHTPVRRAIFVLDHPDLGRSVIKRDPFRRKVLGKEILRARDECRRKGSLVEVAQQAIAYVFKGTYVKLDRRGMFSTRGMCYQPVESTVFHLDMQFDHLCHLLQPEQYIILSDHRLCGRIEPLLKTLEVSPKKRAIG